MLDGALNLSVAGDVHAKAAQSDAIPGRKAAFMLGVGLRQRLDDLGNVALVDRSGVMKARNDSPQGQSGSIIHVGIPCASCGQALCEHTDAEYRGQGA